jgi:hypothetical protein
MLPSYPFFSHFSPLWWYRQTWLNWSKIDTIEESRRRKTLRLWLYREPGDIPAAAGRGDSLLTARGLLGSVFATLLGTSWELVVVEPERIRRPMVSYLLMESEGGGGGRWAGVCRYRNICWLEGEKELEFTITGAFLISPVTAGIRKPG